MFRSCLFLTILGACRALKAKLPEAQFDMIHLTMLTDRDIGAASALQSVCSNAASQRRLHFHVIGPTEQMWSLSDLAPMCAKGGATLTLYPLDSMTVRIQEAGFDPVWMWPSLEHKPGNFVVRPGDWDNSTTHNHPFNMLRFYLAYIEPFRYLPKVIFMDDDILIFGDVAKAWDAPLRPESIMTASCQNWVWKDCGGFESSTTLSYLDVPYFGVGVIGDPSNPVDPKQATANAACQDPEDKECVPSGFFEMLYQESVAINGRGGAITPEVFAKTTAWNFGFNLFDLNAWRQRDMTKRFESWMKVNAQRKIFPQTSLAYGLGIAMLANIGTVQCFDDTTPVLQGLGFVDPIDMRKNGFKAQQIQSSFGVHYNGPNKPWEIHSHNPYTGLFLNYAPPEQRQGFYEALDDFKSQRQARRTSLSTSFILLTDPRSGSEWIMEMLDKHPEVCASGEAADGARGFPREALLPGRYVHKREMRAQLEEAQQRAALGGNGTADLPTANLGKLGTEVASWGKYKKETTCPEKVGCSWGSLAASVWQVAQDLSVCQTAEHGDLAVTCALAKQSTKLLQDRGITVTPATLVTQTFRVFWDNQMWITLMNDEYNAGQSDTVTQMLPCKCPATSLVAGQKIMNDWVGGRSETSPNMEDWMYRPFDVNYNAATPSDMKAPFYNLIGAMAEVGTKVIIFERKNILARYVSIKIANATAVFHCESQDCVDSLSKLQVRVEFEDFLKFMDRNKERAVANRELLKQAKIDALYMSYETCLVSTRACMYKIWAFLEVANDAKTDFTATKLQRTITDLPSRIENCAEIRPKLEALNLGHWLSEPSLQAAMETELMKGFDDNGIQVVDDAQPSESNATVATISSDGEQISTQPATTSSEAGGNSAQPNSTFKVEIVDVVPQDAAAPPPMNVSNALKVDIVDVSDEGAVDIVDVSDEGAVDTRVVDVA